MFAGEVQYAARVLRGLSVRRVTATAYGSYGSYAIDVTLK